MFGKFSHMLTRHSSLKGLTGCLPMSLVVKHQGGKPENELFLYTLNENSQLIDALPYVDGFTNEAKDEANELIAREMTQFQPRNYLAPLPLPSTPHLDAAFLLQEQPSSTASGAQQSSEQLEPSFVYAWQHEIRRLKQGNASFQRLDTSRYELPCPSQQDARNATAWRRCIDIAKAQTENSTTRQITLDMLSVYAQPAWQKHLQQLQALETFLKKRVSQLKTEEEDINKRRKLEQVSGGNTLRVLMNDYKDAFEKNMTLIPTIHTLDQEVQHLSDSLET